MTATPFQPPSPLQPAALINTAENAINNTPSPGPTRETIHRAISTAYYAIFHAINASNATTRHGAPTGPDNARTWTNTYRQMRHNFAATSLSQHLFNLSTNARVLANGFTNLKIARETADYDPNRVLTTADANYWIQETRNALIALQTMTVAERQTIMRITLTGRP